MSEGRARQGLVVLTACGNAEHALRGILGRHESLGIRAVAAEFHVHPERDPGVFLRAHDFLRTFRNTHAHALVLLDREGSGREWQQTREEMEAAMEDRLAHSGWTDGDFAAVVTDPELDVWVWSDSPHVDEVLGWAGRRPDLRSWLRSPPRCFLTEASPKPARPKEALQAALREARKPRSSAMYRQLASKVSLDRCTDPAFVKLRDVLRRWFS